MPGADDHIPLPSVFTTPLSSPTKSTSTWDWSSPPTPTSPSKTPNRLVFQDSDSEIPFLTPPRSPNKLKFPVKLRKNPISTLVFRDHQDDALAILDGDVFTNESPKIVTGVNIPSSAITPSDGRSSPSSPCSNGTSTKSSTNLPTTYIPPTTHSDSTTSNEDDYSIRVDSEGIGRREHDTLQALGVDVPSSSHLVHSKDKNAQRELNRIPLRSASSPLRPSQWAARGGLLSTPRTPPDRFISSRSPPFVTREGFESSRSLNRPAHEISHMYKRNATLDPFSRRLHRSTRMNDELRSLQQNYSTLASRAHLDRRGTTSQLRQGFSTMTPRQASIGAIWNVGGASAASDTVTGVSNGRGGLLGSGTNAPLYTSMFLNKSDPDAKKETYSTLR